MVIYLYPVSATTFGPLHRNLFSQLLYCCASPISHHDLRNFSPTRWIDTSVTLVTKVEERKKEGKSPFLSILLLGLAVYSFSTYLLLVSIIGT